MERRRKLGLALVALLALAGLAACGSGDDDGGDAAGGGGGASAGAFPVTIEHAFGETTIEEEPERVVTVGLTEQDTLLALGVVPVATTEWFGDHPGAIFPWAQDELEELGGDTPEVMSDATEINVEAVAAQRPDLILAINAELDQEVYDSLSEIAPTVARPEGTIPYGVPWDEATRMIGRAVGRAEEADALVEDVEAELAAVRDEHPEFEGATAVVATPWEGIYVYGPNDARGQLLTELGFEMPPGLAELTGDEFGANLSQERAEMLDVDVIVWLDPEDGEGPLGGPLYETFPVHTEGREVFLDSYDDPLGAATSVVTPLSIPFLLDGLAPRLAAAIDGDPATELPAS
ncbi:MAG TPA: iron-siderophore ABC transporter substrate-binding protein [Acidimicrobiales bacterium]